MATRIIEANEGRSQGITDTLLRPSGEALSNLKVAKIFTDHFDMAKSRTNRLGTLFHTRCKL